ncbi:restriction endonuclease subunit S [Sulfitobacter pontiacus]|uniref:restriction endonuclease subunit S n=1 Tax=Sulfitobacter pontiacus TaxID=60137 RepID=UPI00274AA4C5|nr:restriction endonuclease subunit S [Sulfitobacter pontiacus]GLO80311.1 restriction endonuclease [Sulfitobacter pontiacus]
MREGWKEVQFEEIVADTQLGTTERGLNGEENSVALIKMGNLTWGGFNLRSVEKIACHHIKDSDMTLKFGDLLFNTRNSADLVGKSAVWRAQITSAAFDNNINRIRLKAVADPEFYGAFLNTGIGKKRVQSLAVGSTSVAAIYWKDIKTLRVPLPPIKEQRKIAVILRTWEEALEKLNALRAAKARQLDGLAAKLIHDDQVERLHLRGFLKEKSTRNRDEQVQRVLSVTNSAGFVLAEEQFAHRVASASLSNYKIVRRGQYAYNPSRINVGSIARLDAWDEGALSPMYVVFQVQGGLDADFFGHWLRSAEARQRIALAAQGSVRETVSFGDLGSILVPVPTIERQQAIAKGLNAAQAEISLLDDEIKAVTRQKRGLMQKLLTGEWRVEVSDDEEAAA